MPVICIRTVFSCRICLIGSPWYCQNKLRKWEYKGDYAQVAETTWERATGKLFDVNLPPERFPLGCGTLLDGILFIVFLDPSVPCMLGTLKLPWMLCKPWRFPATNEREVKLLLKKLLVKKLLNLQFTYQCDDKQEELHQIGKKRN